MFKIVARPICSIRGLISPKTRIANSRLMSANSVNSYGSRRFYSAEPAQEEPLQTSEIEKLKLELEQKSLEVVELKVFLHINT